MKHTQNATMTRVLAMGFMSVLLLSCGSGQLPSGSGQLPSPTIAPSPTQATGIAGRVYYAATSQPIPGVAIQLNHPISPTASGQDPKLTVAETRTDADGRYSFTDVAPGSYAIKMQWLEAGGRPTALCSNFGIKVSVNESAYLDTFEGTSNEGGWLFNASAAVTVEPGALLQEEFMMTCS